MSLDSRLSLVVQDLQTIDKKKAVVQLSDGLDSTTVLAIANAAGYEAYALPFRYEQRHSVELDLEARVTSELCADKPAVRWRKTGVTLFLGRYLLRAGASD